VLEQTGNALTFLTFYVESKVGKTGLTVTCNVRRGTTLVVSGGSAIELGDGLYYYTLSSSDVTTEELYSVVFKTATTSVDQRDMPALWVVSKAGIENLNAPIDTRLPTLTYTAPDNTGIGTLLTRLSALRAGYLDTIPNLLLASAYTAPDNASIGVIKGQTDKLNFTGTDVKATLDGEPVTPADGALTLPKFAADYLDDLRSRMDAALAFYGALVPADLPANFAALLISAQGKVTVGTNDDKSGYALSAAGITAVQSGLALAAALAALQTDADSIQVVTDKLNTVLEVAGLAYRFTAAALANAPTGGAGTDPLLNEVPGDYDPGTAGHELGILRDVLTAQGGTFISPMWDGKNLIVTAGTAYKHEDGLATNFTKPSSVRSLWLAQSVTFYVKTNRGVSVAVPLTVVDANTAYLEFEASETTALLQATNKRFSIIALYDDTPDDPVEMAAGILHVRNSPQ
jgi:hypothetical protein